MPVSGDVDLDEHLKIFAYLPSVYNMIILINNIIMARQLNIHSYKHP